MHHLSQVWVRYHRSTASTTTPTSISPPHSGEPCSQPHHLHHYISCSTLPSSNTTLHHCQSCQPFTFGLDPPLLLKYQRFSIFESCLYSASLWLFALMTAPPCSPTGTIHPLSYVANTNPHQHAYSQVKINSTATILLDEIIDYFVASGNISFSG